MQKIQEQQEQQEQQQSNSMDRSLTRFSRSKTIIFIHSNQIWLSLPKLAENSDEIEKTTDHFDFIYLATLHSLISKNVAKRLEINFL